MRKLVIYGAGALGREMRVLARALDPEGRRWHFAGFADDALPEGTCVSDSHVLGDKRSILEMGEPVDVVMGMASPSARAVLYEELTKSPFVSFPVLIHPLASVDSSVVLSPGVVVSVFCFVSIDIRLGRCVFLNAGAHVGHDSRVGDFCAVMPSCNISGNVVVGPRTLIGAGARILQGRSVGSDATVGIGSVVLDDVPDGCTVLGNPAQIVKKAGENRRTQPERA